MADDRHAELVALGNAVARRRRTLEMSLDALAEASGVSRTLISGIERGHRNASMRTVFKLASALGARPSDLVREAEVDAPGT